MCFGALNTALLWTILHAPLTLLKTDYKNRVYIYIYIYIYVTVLLVHLFYNACCRLSELINLSYKLCRHALQLQMANCFTKHRIMPRSNSCTWSTVHSCHSCENKLPNDNHLPWKLIKALTHELSTVKSAAPCGYSMGKDAVQAKIPRCDG